MFPNIAPYSRKACEFERRFDSLPAELQRTIIAYAVSNDELIHIEDYHAAIEGLLARFSEPELTTAKQEILRSNTFFVDLRETDIATSDERAPYYDLANRILRRWGKPDNWTNTAPGKSLLYFHDPYGVGVAPNPFGPKRLLQDVIWMPAAARNIRHLRLEYTVVAEEDCNLFRQPHFSIRHVKGVIAAILVVFPELESLDIVFSNLGEIDSHARYRTNVGKVSARHCPEGVALERMAKVSEAIEAIKNAQLAQALKHIKPKRRLIVWQSTTSDVNVHVDFDLRVKEAGGEGSRTLSVAELMDFPVFICSKVVEFCFGDVSLRSILPAF